MKQNEITVELLITDFQCSPEEISKILDLSPSGGWEKGDIVESVVPRSRKIIRKENCWFLEPKPESKNGSIEEQSKSIFQIIGSKIKNFKNLPLNAYIELSCCMYIYDQNIMPEIHLNNKITKNLALINSEFDLDLYCLTQLPKK